jgi:hypothetical protein
MSHVESTQHRTRSVQVFPPVDPGVHTLYWLGHFCCRQTLSLLHVFVVSHWTSACRVAWAALDAEEMHVLLQVESWQLLIQLMMSKQVCGPVVVVIH